MKKILKTLALVVGLFAIGIGIGAAVSGATAGYMVLTNLQILTDDLASGSGNLRVGDGTPTVTLDGEDVYIEGTFEADGATRLDGAVTASSTLAVTGASTLTGLTTLNGGLTLAAAKNVLLPATAVSLTSPTVTFAAADKCVITLNSDANQTGIHPIGGTAGQVLIIVSGAGSNTMQFDDDATSMTIGGNVVLTEAQNDSLILRCVTAPVYGAAGYGIWQALAAHDN